MSDLTCSLWSCQSGSKACVLNSVVKKIAHTWKKAAEGEVWHQRSPYFHWSSIGFKPSNLRNSLLWLTSTRLWGLTYNLEFSHTVHAVHCMTRKVTTLGGEHAGTGRAGSLLLVSHCFPPAPPPSAASQGRPGLLPTAAARGSVSGNLVAKTRVELVKTNPAFSFVGRIDLPSSIKIHRIWILKLLLR